MFFVFLTLLLVQEIAILYCAYRLVFGQMRTTSRVAHSVARMRVPEFAKVKIHPPSMIGGSEGMIQREKRSHKSHRRMLSTGSSMTMAAGT
jgi:hypothetical protein